MKTSIFLLSFILLASALKSQTLDESIDWLNSKKSESTKNYSKTITTETYSSLVFTPEKIGIENSDKTSYSYISWDKVCSFRKTDADENGTFYAAVVSSVFHDGIPIYIFIGFKTEAMRDRFLNALIHVAELKDADIVSESPITNEEILAWLNSRGIDIFSNNNFRTKIDINGISTYTSGSTTIDNSVLWKDITDIKHGLAPNDKNYYYINIVGKTDAAGKTNSFHTWVSVVDGSGLKYIEMLRSLAQRMGAKLIKEDLF